MVGGVRKGAWTEEEDSLLRKCIEKFGEGKWHQVPLRAGLNRCRKSCRLRWLNYLRPNIKRGNFSSDEVDLIIRLHNLLGNRWSLIAGRLPGRTANDVKNYWNTHQTKKCKSKQDLCFSIRNPTKPSTTRVSKVLKPRPRIFIRHNNIPFVVGDNKSKSIISNTNNNESFRRIPSNESIEEVGFSSLPPLENNAMEFFDGLFQNDGKEIWSSHGDDEEVMKRFWSEDITPFLGGNSEVEVQIGGESKNKDKEKTIVWDNDVNECAIDMDIWELLGYTQDHVAIQ